MARSAKAIIVRLGLTPRSAATGDPSQNVHIFVPKHAVAVGHHAVIARIGHDATADSVDGAGHVEQDLWQHPMAVPPASWLHCPAKRFACGMIVVILSPRLAVPLQFRFPANFRPAFRLFHDCSADSGQSVIVGMPDARRREAVFRSKCR